MAGYRFLQEEAYAHIKEQIVTGSLAEDQIYSETKLAAGSYTHLTLPTTNEV